MTRLCSRFRLLHCGFLKRCLATLGVAWTSVALSSTTREVFLTENGIERMDVPARLPLALQSGAQNGEGAAAAGPLRMPGVAAQALRDDGLDGLAPVSRCQTDLVLLLRM